MLAERADGNGRISFEAASAADLDPFAHPGLVANVESAIKRLVAGEPVHAETVNGMAPAVPGKAYPALDLSPYEPLPGSERLARYSVTDRASGKSFEVVFVVQGNVIWGWDVRPREE